MWQVTRSRTEALLPWRIVHVSGPSMVPTLYDGDLVLVRYGAPVRAGDVVLGRFRALPDVLVIKRASYPENGGWWVNSDNEFAAGDSRVHGVADIEARVLLRLPNNPNRGRRVWRIPTRVRRRRVTWETERPG
jgi:signal peptidase I